MTDLAAALRLLTHIRKEYLNLLRMMQQEVTGEPDRLRDAAAQHGREATRVTGVARLMAEQHESVAGHWSGFAGQSFQRDAKVLVEKLAVIENGVRRERDRLYLASELLRRTRSRVDSEITTFAKQANAILFRAGREDTIKLTNAMGSAGELARQRALVIQKNAGTRLAELFSTADVSLGLPYDLWRTNKEYDSILNYIHQEMVNNAQSDHVASIRGLNSNYSGLVAANLWWAERVGPNRPWDHKPKISELYEMARRQRFAFDGHRDIYSPMPVTQPGRPPEMISYQVWSNVHYGYVGLEAGFSEKWLKDGADIADKILRGTTDPGDAVAIEIGMQLRKDFAPDQLRPEHVEAAIMRRHYDLLKYGKIQPSPELVP